MSAPQKIGRYEILDELGRGAMGSVYRAKDPAMDRIVALKTIISAVLASEQGAEFRERFFREARAAGQLTHPGIVPVFDMGEHDGSPFLVMEYVDGWTLASAAARGERLDLNRMCEIGQNVAEALGYAHRRGVVHRDIKPANILLTARETYGTERPRITDFGIAKLAEGEATMTGKMLGTPAFMPPEQFTGAPVDGRADIFSLGVVLYWLATGEQPFPGEGLTAVLYKVVHTEPIPPRKLNPSLPARFEKIILKCMEKDPAARFQTAEELAQELAEVRAGKTATASVAMPRTLGPAGDTAATLVEAVRPAALLAAADDTTVIVASPAATPPAAASPQPAAASPTAATSTSVPARPPAKRGLLFAALTIVLLAGAGWFAIQSHHKASAPSTAETTPAAAPSLTAQPPALAPPAAPAPVVSPAAPTSSDKKPAAAVPVAMKSSAAAPASAKLSDTLAAAAPVERSKDSAKAATAPSITALGFDPMTLDPKQNARLTVDAQDMPKGLDFTVEMDGKIYALSSGGVVKDSFVPPVLAEFRVKAKSGAVTKSSNAVSAEFKAKKHYRLTVQLRVNGQPASAGMPNGLYSDSQIVVALK